MVKSGFPRISVIIPSYNNARFLGSTLATISKQEYKPFEVIIVDGESDDNTADVVGLYSDIVTHFVSEGDEGQLDAVQKGIKLATGDVLYWVNADDAVMPGAFMKVASVFSENPEIDIVYGDNYWFEESGRRFGVTHSVKHLTFWDQFLFYGQLQVESFFWRRELSEKALPFDTSLRVYTDYSFFLPMRYKAVCRWIPHRLGAFRVHQDQMSTVNYDKGDAEREAVKRRMRDRLGMSLDEYRRMQKQKRAGFVVRHKIIPNMVSAVRYAARKLTGDYMRRSYSRYFFDEWIRPRTKPSIRQVS